MLTVADGILIALGFIVVLSAVLLKRHAGRQNHWERVRGKVTRSEISRTRWYRHVIEYSYEYKGVTYRGDRLQSLQVSGNWPGPAGRSAAAYPVGAEVDVYVDPDYPCESVLKPGGHPGFVPFIVVFVIIFFGILLSARANAAEIVGPISAPLRSTAPAYSAS